MSGTIFRLTVYRFVPGLWFGDVYEDDSGEPIRMLECVQEPSHALALAKGLDALGRAVLRRRLCGGAA